LLPPSCPQAFVKLESLPTLPPEQREALARLAAAIFLQRPPVDPRSIRETRDKRSGGGGGGGGGSGGGIDAVLEGLGSDQDLVRAASG
jgi:WD repeat-containing protein 35